MKKSYLLALGGSCLFLSISSLAVSMPPSGAYLEGNVGYSHVNERVINSGNDNNDGLGWSVNGGYQFNPNWALEGGFTQHADEILGGGAGATTGKDNYLFDVAAKGIYPWNDTLSLFGKLGAASVHHTLNNAGTLTGTYTRAALYGGVGGAVALSKNLALNVQVNGTSKGGNVPAMILGTVGLTAIF